jgi:hypothetical protein
VTYAGTLTADAGQWRCEADAAIGTFRMQAAANLREEGGHAVGIVELGVPGTQPFELSGTCSITVDQRSRVLELDLERRPGPFDVAFDGNRWSGDGALAVQALVPFADLDAATFGLRAAGLDVASANGAQLRGMAAELAFHGLPLPVSDGWQTVRWQQVALADLRAGEGSADFVLARGPELHARFRQRAMDDIGELAVSDVRWAPGAESIPATVTLDRVPLQDCLELLSKGRITGEGRLSGTATLAVHTEPRLRVDLHGGRVSAAPGGLVRFLDDAETEALLRSQVGGGGAAGGSEQVQERLVAALKEFVYEVLDFSFQPEGEETVLRVHVAGEGRTVPQKIGIDINVRGFEEALDAAIAIKLGLDRAKQRLAEKIEDPHETVPVQRKP